MKSNFLKFLKQLTIFAALIAALSTIINLNFISIRFVFWIIPFFYLLTISIHYLFLNMIKNNPNKFISAVMLTTFIKMITSMIVLISYALAFRAEAIKFIIVFFILYLLFTIFEIILMQKISIEKNKK